MLRVLELFAGIGACSKALANLGIELEIIDAVEIDKFAIKSFNAIHGTNFEPQDITKWDKDIKVDLVMHGSPCQDFSIAGKQAGGDEGSGTRSSLLYETLRIVEKTRPEIVIWENVKNLISKKHRHNWEAYIDRMSQMGYDSAAQVLNAKDYGIPQNRERVFTVSIKRGSQLVKSYTRPQPRPLELKLKDILEDEVEERYYLTDEQVASFVASTERAKAKGNGFKFEPFERERERVMHAVLSRAGSRQTDNFIAESSAVSPTLSTMQGGSQEPKIIDPQGRKNKVCIPRDYAPTLRAQTHGNLPQAIILASRGYEGVAIRTANKKGYDMATDGDGIDLGYPQSATRRGRVGHGVAKTIPTGDSQGTLDGFRIRKLTPRECWRLMGFDDADFEKAQAIGTSNTQLYKQAGNSIVVNCLMAIIDGIEWNKEAQWQAHRT